MTMANIPDAINESSSDYELIQPSLGRLEEGSGLRRKPYLPQHLRLPPSHPPPPHPVTRLSNRRERNYAGLLPKRQSKAVYATPSARPPRDVHIRDERPTDLCYDAFFHGSQQEEDEIGEQSLIPELGHSDGEHRECCSCGWVTVKSILLCFLVVITLLASLAALGLGLYCVFHHQGTSRHTQCMTTVTMAPPETPCMPTLENPKCTTNCLTTNITVSASFIIISGYSYIPLSSSYACM